MTKSNFIEQLESDKGSYIIKKDDHDRISVSYIYPNGREGITRIFPIGKTLDEARQFALDALNEMQFLNE